MDLKAKMERNMRSGPKLDVPSHATSLMRKEVMIQRLLKEKSRKTPTPVQPSSVLAQVKSFLPKLKIANEELEKSDAATTTEFGTVPPNIKTYIEMNLALYEESSDSDDGDDELELTPKLSDQPSTNSPSTKKLIEDITPESIQ